MEKISIRKVFGDPRLWRDLEYLKVDDMMLTRRICLIGMLATILFLIGCVEKSSTYSDLNGMYYGFRSDFGGSECGGLCWDLYTFLPKNKVVIGVPVNGGPEMIDCEVDECLDYIIEDEKIKLSNGESLPFEETEANQLIIDNVNLTAVEPAPKELTLNNKYKNITYSGLIGVNAGASSKTSYLTLRSDGTFEMSGVSIGSIGATSGVSTHGSGGSDEETGLYEIKQNTITLKATDGSVSNLLFFIHDSNLNDIQIGGLNYYVPED